MHRFLIDALQCPACGGALRWEVAETAGDRIEMAEAACLACSARYPVREGIGLFLTPDLPRNDLWEQAGSRLSQHLAAHPDVARQLMDAPLASLTPADRFFRAMALDERGDYAQARAAREAALPGVYTRAYLNCAQSQVDYVIDQLAGADGPVVDLASGMGFLVEAMARRLQRPIVATDFSPRVLRRDRRWLESLGLYDRVSLLAFDARRSPFRDGAVATLTSYLGLANIEEPGPLLDELRRVVSGRFLAVSHFYPEDDEANKRAIDQLGLSDLLFRRAALARFAAAGWQASLVNVRAGAARPTPASALLGAGIDGLPVAPTTLEWGVIVAQ